MNPMIVAAVLAVPVGIAGGALLYEGSKASTTLPNASTTGRNAGAGLLGAAAVILAIGVAASQSTGRRT